MHFDDEHSDLLVNLEAALRSYLPSIAKAAEWPRFQLIHDKSERIQSRLIYQMDQNADFLRTVHQSLANGISLQRVPMRLRHDTDEVILPHALIRFAQDPELVQQAEEAIVEWMKEIDHVNVRSRLCLTLGKILVLSHEHIGSTDHV